jgi:hypothetical protein
MVIKNSIMPDRLSFRAVTSKEDFFLSVWQVPFRYDSYNWIFCLYKNMRDH